MQTHATSLRKTSETKKCFVVLNVYELQVLDWNTMRKKSHKASLTRNLSVSLLVDTPYSSANATWPTWQWDLKNVAIIRRLKHFQRGMKCPLTDLDKLLSYHREFSTQRSAFLTRAPPPYCITFGCRIKKTWAVFSIISAHVALER